MSHSKFRPVNDNEIHMLLCQSYSSKFYPYIRSGLRHLSSENYELSEDTLYPFDALEVSYETIFSDYHTHHRTNPTPEFVICLIRCYINEHPIAFVWRGVSRCAKGDTFNRQRGEALAFLRAIRHSKPVEI